MEVVLDNALVELVSTRPKGRVLEDLGIRVVAPTGGAGKEAVFEAVLIPCARVTCSCRNVLLKWETPSRSEGVEKPVVPFDFWFDLNNGKSYLKENASPEGGLDLTALIECKIQPAQRDRLREWFLKAKLEDVSDNLEKVDLSKLPELNVGQFVCFTEIFPFGPMMRVVHEGIVWEVDEYHCVELNCRCSNVVLRFDPFKANGGKTDESEAVVFEYNFKSGSGEVTQRGRIVEPNSLLKEVKRTYSDLDLSLRLRQAILSFLYLKKHQQSLEARVVQLTKSVGRNDPCPCGSGKKYKKCCLR